LRISVVIPTYNSMKTFRRCVESARNQTSHFIEIIVVDRFSRDGLAGYAGSKGATVIQSDSNRSEARNIGLRKASSDGVLFIDADMILPPTLGEDCERGLVNNDALIIPEYSIGVGFWAACKAAEKKLHIGDPLMEAARCFRRNVLLSMGGYRTQLEAGEDWDLQRRLSTQTLRIGRVNSVVLHDEGRLSLSSISRKKYLYGKSFGRYMRRNPKLGMSQVNPFRRIVSPGLRTLTVNPKLAVGLVIMKSLELTSAAFGFAVGSNGQEYS